MKTVAGVEWIKNYIGDFASIEESAINNILIKEGLKEVKAADRPNPRKAGSVAIVPVFGVLMKRPSIEERVFEGAINTETVAANVQAAAADPNVKAIVMHIDSPGGSVAGIEEAAAIITEAKKSKHVVALADSMAASAAYWLACCADEIVVTPSGDVGSIGVIATHFDVSKALENFGVKVSMIKAGKYKGEGSPYEPLGEEAQAYMQDRVNAYYASFVNVVAKGRGVSAEKVKNDFGGGRVIGAKEAVKLGMADRVGSLNDVLHTLGASSLSVMPKAINLDLAAKKLALHEKS